MRAPRLAPRRSRHRDSRAAACVRACRCAALRHFKHVVLCSATLDRYCPFHSARIEVAAPARVRAAAAPPAIAASPGALTDLATDQADAPQAKFGTYVREMAEALLRGVEPERVLRLDINNKVPSCPAPFPRAC